MSPRIVIVGGGSYHWAPRLLCDFANTPSLAAAEVVLHDLDAERLKLMEELGGEIAQPARHRSRPPPPSSTASARSPVPTS